MKMVNNTVIYEALAEQYLRSILDISADEIRRKAENRHFEEIISCQAAALGTSLLGPQAVI